MISVCIASGSDFLTSFLRRSLWTDAIAQGYPRPTLPEVSALRRSFVVGVASVRACDATDWSHIRRTALGGDVNGRQKLEVDRLERIGAALWPCCCWTRLMTGAGGGAGRGEGAGDGSGQGRSGLTRTRQTRNTADMAVAGISTKRQAHALSARLGYIYKG